MRTVFLFHDQKRKFVPLKDGLTIGRTSGDLQFEEDLLISKLHCRFHVRGSEIFVEDLDSTNRTQVNRVPIMPHRKRKVLLNDVIKVGDQRLILTQQKAHVPPGSQDVTACKNLVLDPDLYREHVEGHPKREGTASTMVLANKELDHDLGRVAISRRREKVRRAKPSARRSRRWFWVTGGIAAAGLAFLCLKLF